jgi:aspartate/methionine/tyrosine aminotransferase
MAEAIRPFLVMEVLERALELEREGRSILHLEVGEPDFQTPEVIREAGIRAIRDGKTHYTHSLGHPALREAIAAWQKAQYGVRVRTDQIIVTSGSSAAMLLALGALLDPGDRVLLPDPGYACYPKFVRAFGGSPVGISLREEEAFQYPLDRLDRVLKKGARVIVLNSPSNPTGTVMTAKRIKALAQLAEGRAVILSDEIYHGLVYEGRAHCIREFSRESLVINGFSKLFAMTGWRLGYAILPAYLVRPVQKLQQNLYISAADFTQYAALAALTEAQAEVEAMRQEYDKRRRLVLEHLDKMNLGAAAPPTGAFYVWINVGRFTSNVYDFAFQILQEAGVAVTPGVDFGANGEGYIRICYANSISNLEEAMSRLSRFFSQLPES